MEALRAIELRLLRLSLPPPLHKHHTPSPWHQLHPLIASLESGNYRDALASPAARAVFGSLNDSAESANVFYGELLPQCVKSFLLNDDVDVVEKCYRGLIVVAIAVASLLAFAQSNIIGPFMKFQAMPLLEVTFGKEDKDVNCNWAEWEGWAQRELMAAGSDLSAKFSHLQYIVLAKVLLISIRDLSTEENLFPNDELRSMSWWIVRLILIQQKLLDDRSSSLFDLLQVFMRESLDHFDSSEKLTNYFGSDLSGEDALSIVSMLHLEAGILDLTYGRIDSFRHHWKLAAVSSSVDIYISGALGFRTVHQVEPKAQLLLVAGGKNNVTDMKPGPELKSGNSQGNNGSSFQHPNETREASDVLMAPRFVEDDNITENSSKGDRSSTVASVQFNYLQQVVIVAQCLSIEKSARNDELQMWKMAPYIEAIDSQQSSLFIIKYMCDILRIRWESTRSRTKQRSLLMMEKLVEGLYEASPPVAQRIYCSFGVDVLTIPALRKEYGDLLVSCGLLGEAVKVYEDLELWDNLIYCYRLLEKKAAAVELIRKRLSEHPRDPRLWCSLGDVTIDDACYTKALEVSDNRSARAQRSLARSAYNRGDYETSKNLWERAMALNSLYPDGWFALGAAALKGRDTDKALDGFTRAVQLDPDNGEAWNNVACLYVLFLPLL
ncbi:hypothetical protein LIER_11901 [Lithospermum erythrorhizon]|uniref:Uncharacterized protein n=1 Tax=Lithospermum erythrorhizon TaxID=34254 RepID=A0AAV3PUW4_LITER